MRLKNFNLNKRKILAGITLLLFLFTLPLAVYLVQQRQIIKKEAAPSPGRLKYYGVDNAFPNEFNWLSQQGVNFVSVAISGGGDSQGHYTAARENGIKLAVWPIGGGEASTPWGWQGGNNWDISGGMLCSMN